MAAGLTFKTIQDRVITYGFGEADRTNIKGWINVRYSDIVGRRRWSWLSEQLTLNTVTGQSNYSIATLTTNTFSRHGRLQSTQLTAPDPVFVDMMSMDDWAASRNIGDLTTRGVPEFYGLWDGELWFWPVPAAVYSYTWKFYKTYTELSADGDIPLVPANFSNVLVIGALAEAAQRDRDPELYALRSAEFERKINEMIGADRSQQEETPRRAVMPTSYGGLYNKRPHRGPRAGY
jgi:hypothetical protein